MNYNFIKSSYSNDDVIVLLNEIKNGDTFLELSIEEKENLIQSGTKHYSSIITKEELPTKEQLNVFYESLNKYKEKIAYGVKWLSNEIINYGNKQGKDKFIIISLVRAGVPLGVLLKRELSKNNQLDIHHYGVSIIRDKGLDKKAMSYLFNLYSKDEYNYIFVDGWIGKGAITFDLYKSVTNYNINLPFNLFTLNSCVNFDLENIYFPYSTDWLIPTGLLNSVVSGLFSRSIITDENDFHKAIYYKDFEKNDLSNYFINTISDLLEGELHNYTNNINIPTNYKIIKYNLDKLAKKYNVSRFNNIKPSISESIRAVLRRKTHYILVENKNDEDIQLLLNLAHKNNITIIEEKDLIRPYKTIAIIGK